jgi:hypothetical protein
MKTSFLRPSLFAACILFAGPLFAQAPSLSPAPASLTPEKEAKSNCLSAVNYASLSITASVSSASSFGAKSNWYQCVPNEESSATIYCDMPLAKPWPGGIAGTNPSMIPKTWPVSTATMGPPL